MFELLDDILNPIALVGILYLCDAGGIFVTSKIRWRKIAWPIGSVGLLVAGLLGYRLLNPDAFGSMRCVYQDADGVIQKGASKQCNSLPAGAAVIILQQ